MPRFRSCPGSPTRKDGQTVDYEYVYRENHLGVIPSVLSNVYLLGYTRPLTGGLSNITENAVASHSQNGSPTSHFGRAWSIASRRRSRSTIESITPASRRVRGTT
jgi:hypothetical protein